MTRGFAAKVVEGKMNTDNRNKTGTDTTDAIDKEILRTIFVLGILCL